MQSPSPGEIIPLADAAGNLILIDARLSSRSSRHTQRVFGFFAGPSHWSGAHAKYRYFFTEGVKAAVATETTVDTAACFYREDGRGTNAIMGALGRALLKGVRANFSSGFLDEYAIGLPDGNVVIRSETIQESV